MGYILYCNSIYFNPPYEMSLDNTDIFERIKDLLEQGITLTESKKVVGISDYLYNKTLTEQQKLELKGLCHVFTKTGIEIFEPVYKKEEGKRSVSDWPKKLQPRTLKPGKDKKPPRKIEKVVLPYVQLDVTKEVQTEARIINKNDL